MKTGILFIRNLLPTLLLASLIGTAFAANSTPASSRAGVTTAARFQHHAVEVVFVLDTTGSMGGLIAAAKEKIWSIANTLAMADPTPDIRMGLVGYRDRGDAYVTTRTPLSSDLDAIYSRLMEFQAGGGGDTPESVNQALYEAVSGTHWSKSPSTYRVIFLVGDAPPQMRYPDDIKYQQTCALAAKKDIIINAIQCGNLSETAPFWKEIAEMANGRYFNVAQSGSAILHETPFDNKIAELSHALDETRVFYGSKEQIHRMAERQARADKIYETAAPSAVARRTIFNSQKAGAKNFLGAQELISDLESGAMDLDRIQKDDLPAKLRKLDKAELKNHLASQRRLRRDLKSRIAELAQKRQAYIEDKIAAETRQGTDSLDAGIYACIQAQAGVKGIIYHAGPAY